MPLICPRDDCKQIVASRDNKHYGVHFPNLLATVPCGMSCKPIVEQKEPEPMLKKDEIRDPGSCLNKAEGNEYLFVLRGKDVAAPATIRFWANERIRLGKNQPHDRQIVEALASAKLMEDAQ